jgi:hypothetical protein
MEDQSFGETSLNINPRPKKRLPSRALFLIIAAIILLLIIFAISRSFFGGSSSESISETPTPTEFQFPTDIPEESITPEESPTDEPTKTPTPKPTSNPVDKESGLNRSKLSVAVENGSGVAGAAGKAANILKSLGYNVVSTSNAETYDYENLTIKVKSEVSEYLALLKKDLGVDYTIGATGTDLSASTSANALVIIGK